MGKDDFLFGPKWDVNSYNKSNNEKIVTYGGDGYRMPNWDGFSEIYLKDGEVLRFSNILIDVLSFRTKFPQELIVRGSKSQYLMF